MRLVVGNQPKRDSKKSTRENNDAKKRRLRFAILKFCETNDEAAVVDALIGAGTKTKEARATAKQAREQIARAADTDRRAEIGLEKTRLDQIYEAAIGNGDYKIAMRALHERSRLLGLSRVNEELCDADRYFETSELEEARTYLESLQLFDSGLPMAELCRMAAKKIIDLTTRSVNNGQSATP